MFFRLQLRSISVISSIFLEEVNSRCKATLDLDPVKGVLAELMVKGYEK